MRRFRLCSVVVALSCAFSTNVFAQEIEDEELKSLREDAEAVAGPVVEKGASSGPSTSTQLLNAMNPQITVFGDVVVVADPETLGQTESHSAVSDLSGAAEPSEPSLINRFSVREVEVDLRAAIDPFAKGVVILGFAEEEPREYAFDLEEAYLTFGRLPLKTNLKLGRFRAPFGQINRLHSHDLPMTNEPLPVQRLLSEEGEFAFGGEFSWLAPLTEGDSLSIQLAIINPENPNLFRESTTLPAAMFHMGNFLDLSEVSFFEIGGTWYGGFDEDQVDALSQLVGVDLMLKLRPTENAQARSFVFQGEGFYQHSSGLHSGEDRSALGLMTLLLYQLDLNWYFGARYEGYQKLDSDEPFVMRTGATLSYYTTEFLRLRLNYDLERDGNVDNHLVTLQSTFVFGSHPVEPYWFNR